MNPYVSQLSSVSYEFLPLFYPSEHSKNMAESIKTLRKMCDNKSNEMKFEGIKED